jgi:hypothetical protein
MDIRVRFNKRNPPFVCHSCLSALLSGETKESLLATGEYPMYLLLPPQEESPSSQLTLLLLYGCLSLVLPLESIHQIILPMNIMFFSQLTLDLP